MSTKLISELGNHVRLLLTTEVNKEGGEVFVTQSFDFYDDLGNSSSLNFGFELNPMVLRSLADSIEKFLKDNKVEDQY